MKTHWLLRLIAFLSVITVCFGLNGCNKPNAPIETVPENNSREEYGFTEGKTLDTAGTVNVYAFSEGQNYNKVIQKFKELTKDTLKTDLNFQWATDIKTEQPLQLASQNDIDLIFDAGWLNSANNISQGMYQDISGYFLNPDYPGLMKAFPSYIVEAMKNPADGNIYGIPFFNTYNTVKCIFIRGDWRIKLGCAPVTDDKTFMAYLKEVDEHKEELAAVSAMGLSDRGWYYYKNNTYSLRNKHIFEIPSTGIRVTQSAYALLNDTNDKVLDILYIGDPDSAAAEWPAEGNFLNHKAEELAKSWGRYVNVDSGFISGFDVKDRFVAGAFGALESDIGSYTELLRGLLHNYPEASLEYYIYEEEQKNRENIILDSDIANNYLYIPFYNEDPDRAMAVLDWVFQSQANNDLFNYGIEGEDWVGVGNNRYKVLQSDNSYYFPGWLFSNNPIYTRYDVDCPEDIISYLSWGKDINNFTKSPFMGFVFDIEPISTEYAVMTTIQRDYYKQFMAGGFGVETNKKLKEFYEKSKEYSAVVKEEVKRQLNEYFMKKKP